ncbi:MBL fold metallo-hydrolase [Phenylobacterium sp. J426]|uniref:MBL fold metallo-hydrolase n=1 Tax=Phenylobacterium sp. J426 TaxID=2898439 RepID=UPI00215170E5|nr:MBL fold metallo-hydrolase [Phenylobacterium sp. J426]MCR5876751.1 MBL fold metallo-hydrolase [Phenylobacterium sp. J426]
MRERVWTIRDFSIVNCIVVETRDGLVVFDTGVNIGEGETFLAEIRKLSNKPILAIVYSHSHYTRGPRRS